MSELYIAVVAEDIKSPRATCWRETLKEDSTVYLIDEDNFDVLIGVHLDGAIFIDKVRSSLRSFVMSRVRNAR